MDGAPLNHLEYSVVPPYMHSIDQEAMRANHDTSDVSRTDQVSYMQVLPNFTHTSGSRSTGRRPASPLHSSSYYMVEYTSVS
jgi:hypothetical protein